MAVQLPLFIALLAGLGLAAELVARGTEELERSLGQGISGGIVLGLLVALPETIVVVVAVLNRSYDVAVGAAIGGNVLIFTIGLGILGLAYFLRWGKTLDMRGDYRIEYYFVLVSTLFLIPVSLYGHLDRASGGALVFLYAFYVYYRVSRSKMQRAGPVRKLRVGVLLVAGVILMTFLSDPFVHSIDSLSTSTGIQAGWLALVVTPFGSEIGELVSTFRLSVRTQMGGSLSVVGLAGAKIQNATFLMGVIGLLSSGAVPLRPVLPDIGATVVAGLLGVAVLLDGRLGVRDSALLLAMYFVLVLASYFV